MNATEELFQLADAAAAGRARCQEKILSEPLRVLRQVCEEVGRVWSGSNIGYHATVYYAGLQPKPPMCSSVPNGALKIVGRRISPTPVGR